MSEHRRWPDWVGAFCASGGKCCSESLWSLAGYISEDERASASAELIETQLMVRRSHYECHKLFRLAVGQRVGSNGSLHDRASRLQSPCGGTRGTEGSGSAATTTCTRARARCPLLVADRACDDLLEASSSATTRPWPSPAQGKRHVARGHSRLDRSRSDRDEC